MRAKINLYNEDCLQAMKAMADNTFDWAIVDPPYGIAINSQSQGKGGGVAKKIEYTKKDWDKSIPTGEYFRELKRVSKNQIIWGWNYFVSHLNECPSYIVWDKQNGETDFADCESAWCSKQGAARVFKWKWAGMLQQNMKYKEIRIHPTQKPVALYKWLLEKYTSKGDLILDTHLGSGSIAIACWDMGFDLTAYEIDKEYYDKACKRFEQHSKQMQLW